MLVAVQLFQFVQLATTKQQTVLAPESVSSGYVEERKNL